MLCWRMLSASNEGVLCMPSRHKKMKSPFSTCFIEVKVRVVTMTPLDLGRLLVAFTVMLRWYLGQSLILIVILSFSHAFIFRD